MTVAPRVAAKPSPTETIRYQGATRLRQQPQNHHDDGGRDRKDHGVVVVDGGLNVDEHRGDAAHQRGRAGRGRGVGGVAQGPRTVSSAAPDSRRSARVTWYTATVWSPDSTGGLTSPTPGTAASVLR